MVDCLLKLGQDRQMLLRARLLRSDRCYSVAHMLAPNAHRIAAPQAGVEQYCNPYALPRSRGPSGLVGCNVFLSPDGEAFARFEQWIFDFSCGVRFDELRFLRPRKQAAHGI